jgi:Flp pilus assembly protein CpaB
MKRSIAGILVGTLAILLGLYAAWTTAQRVQAATPMTAVVVASRPIPAYTLITLDALAMKRFPSAAVDGADVYLKPGDLTGKVARVEILPDVPIYHTYAVAPEAARLSSDAQSVLVSLPVDTARALGGLIAPGQRVDVWRVAHANPPAGLTADQLLALRGAGVQLIARDVRVLGVRTRQGTQTAPTARTQAPQDAGVTGLISSGPPTPAANVEEITVVVLEASQMIAPTLVRLAGEVGNTYDAWLTLAPLERDLDALALAPVYTPAPEGESEEEAIILAALTPTPLPPSPTPTPTALPPTPVPIVATVGQKGVNVRQGPGTEYPIIATQPAGDVLEPLGRDEAGRWLFVCCVDGARDGARDESGWLLAELVAVTGADISQLPVRAVPPLPAPTAAPTPTAAPQAAAFDYQAFVEYRNEPGDEKLNYVRTRAVSADGLPLDPAFRLEWPGGAVSCPGDLAPKAEGWCEFVVTKGEFTLSITGGRAQAQSLTLPQGGAHTVATVTWGRLW